MKWVTTSWTDGIITPLSLKTPALYRQVHDWQNVALMQLHPFVFWQKLQTKKNPMLNLLDVKVLSTLT